MDKYIKQQVIIMKYLKHIPLEKMFSQGLSLDEGVILSAIFMYTLNGNVCKASLEYFGVKVLNKTERTADRIINKLIEKGYVYKKSGKYTNRSKQEANEYKLSPKCNKIFSTDKTSRLSIDKTSNNIKNKENKAQAGLIPAELRQKHTDYTINFGTEYANKMIQTLIKQKSNI
tara:strand:+ start:50 stop:568 length:519 start_codon:yes stop_codon:yes gene_type:complete